MKISQTTNTKKNEKKIQDEVKTHSVCVSFRPWKLNFGSTTAITGAKHRATIWVTEGSKSTLNPGNPLPFRKLEGSRASG